MAHKIWPGTRAIAQWHLDRGQQVWLVTAAPIEIASVIARRLGLTGALGTVAEHVDGVYTGELVGEMLHGEGKAVAIREIADREGLDLDACYAYSDSSNDLPMLSLVGHPCAVKSRFWAASPGQSQGLAHPRLPHRPQGGSGRQQGRRGRCRSHGDVARAAPSDEENSLTLRFIRARLAGDQGGPVRDSSHGLRVALSLALAIPHDRSLQVALALADSPAYAPSTGGAAPHDDNDPEATRLRALVDLAKEGDAEAFGQLYDHYMTGVFRFIYYRVGSQRAAEDLTSETFVRGLRAIQRFNWQGKDFGAWGSPRSPATSWPITSSPAARASRSCPRRSPRARPMRPAPSRRSCR
ncbi:HAD-IB family hydrolase [Aeromicrobium sp. UC242_57]|uniref:HAD-IB family hydrolase n=1 Tax=Aeromicrobium sp. UC242_57 TaxID=3374624 RepID=UPI0037908B8D